MPNAGATHRRSRIANCKSPQFHTPTSQGSYLIVLKQMILNAAKQEDFLFAQKFVDSCVLTAAITF